MSPHEVHVEPLIDIHVHLREMEKETMKPLIAELIAGGAEYIGPIGNTEKGLTTAKEVIEYKEFAESMVPPGQNIGIMPILLGTEQTTQRDIEECVEAGILDIKWLPRERTTKSHRNGIRHYAKLLPTAKCCGKLGVRMHFHPEHPSMVFDNRDAEFAFLPIADMFLNETQGQIFWEHATDTRCILHWLDFAKSDRFFLTITPQSLLTDENDNYGDVRKIFKSPPKTNMDRHLLTQFVGEDHPFVLAISDFAPHDVEAKHVTMGRCACGVYHGRYILPLFAHALDDLLKKKHGVRTFVNFTSRNSRRVYRLPPASRKSRITLIRLPHIILPYNDIGPWKVELFMVGETILWRKV